MKNKNIPKKISFSGKDYDKWKLHSADFKPFLWQDEFAENINKIAEIVNHNNPRHKDELLETLEKAKSFACSTIIPDGTGFSRVFFKTPNDLKYFIENYQEIKEK
jgi:hypothetical protein